MIRRLFSSQLRLNMASGVMVTVINAVAMMVAFPIYLHFLGYERYGVWLVLGTVLSFARLGNLGIGQAVMKLVAEEHGRGDIEGIQRYVTTALALLCLSGSLILIAVLVFKTQIIGAFKLTGENAKMVSWLLPYIGCLSIYVFIVQALNATLSGLGRMDLTNYIQAVSRIVAVTVAATLLYSGRGIESLLIGNTLSYVFIHVVSLICIWRIARIRLLRINNLDTQRCKRILRFGGAVFGGSLISMLLSPFNKLMLSRYAGVATIPVYEIAFRGSMQVRGLIEGGFRALIPEISRLSGIATQQAKNRIVHIYRLAMRLILFAGVPIYMTLVVFSPLLLRMWLADRFVENLPGVFRIMLIGVSFTGLLGALPYYVIMGFGKVRYLVTASIIAGGSNFLLVTTNYVLTGRVSLCGISICMTLSHIMALTYLYWRVRYLLSRNMTQVMGAKASTNLLAQAPTSDT